MNSLFIYVIARDFGFAPNPFHGTCTLATCKPGIRSAAGLGDWVVGVGGGRLDATGSCIFAMQVNRKLTFNDYWNSKEFYIKRPVRNGSKVMVVGDNIYHRLDEKSEWVQADSHHSNADGTTNEKNLRTDTSRDAVLISDNYIYFGNASVRIPLPLLQQLNYKNLRNHRRFELTGAAAELIEWILSQRRRESQKILADPFDFQAPGTRYNPVEDEQE